jgi:hypothetical protein
MLTVLIVITLLSVSLAATMAAIAWRAILRERRRSAARVAILAAEIADEEIQTPAPSSFSSGPGGGIDLFTTARGSTLGSRTPIAVAASSVIVCAVIVFAVAVSQTDRATAMFHPVDPSPASFPLASADAPAAAGAPIELVSLTHEQRGTQLTIRGVVRNPAGGLALTHLTAVVLLFNRTGVFAGTGRAEVDTTDLEPDGEAHFTVSVPQVSDISRYRVSFSTEDHVVLHVDKRHGA